MSDLPRLAVRLGQAALDQPETLGDGDCEALHGVFGQPVNTLTSLAYVGVGGWLASRIRRLPRNDRAAASAYAGLVALTGLGSVAYHGPQFPGAQFLHDTPILGVAGLGAAVPLWRLARHRTPLPGWSTPLGVGMAATAAAAGAAYLGGGTRSSLCHPQSWLQLHGLWHVGTAAAIGMWGAAVWAPERSPEAEEALDPQRATDDAPDSGGNRDSGGNELLGDDRDSDG